MAKILIENLLYFKLIICYLYTYYSPYLNLVLMNAESPIKLEILNVFKKNDRIQMLRKICISQ